MKKAVKMLTPVLIMAMGIAFLTDVTYAQRGRGGIGSKLRSGGERPAFDPAQIEAQMMARFQEMLGASDEEWAVIQPRIKSVNEARMALRGGAFGGRMRPGGGDRGPGGGDRGPGMRPGGGQEMPEAAALRSTLEDPDSTAEAIQAKLEALRKAREAAATKLAAAQEELRQVLTVKQEAHCVLLGMLD